MNLYLSSNATRSTFQKVFPFLFQLWKKYGFRFPEVETKKRKIKSKSQLFKLLERINHIQQTVVSINKILRIDTAFETSYTPLTEPFTHVLDPIMMPESAARNMAET